MKGRLGRCSELKAFPVLGWGKKTSCVDRIELAWEPTALASGWRLAPKTEQIELVSPIAEIPSMEDAGVGVGDSSRAYVAFREFPKGWFLCCQLPITPAPKHHVCVSSFSKVLEMGPKAC